MKKIIAVLLAAAMVLSLAACSGGTAEPAAQGEETELTTVKKGVLTVATSPDFAPYEFYAIDETGTPQLAGFDMALAQYVADYLGLELEIIPMDFDGTIMELSLGNVDMSLAGYSITEDRKEIMDFSVVYYGGDQSFVTTIAKKDQFKTLEDLNQDGITVAAQVGSIQAGLAKQYSADTDIIETVKVTDIIAELLEGKIDGAYIEAVVAASYAKNYPELFVAMDVPYDTEGTAAGITKGNTALVDAVNEAIGECIATGAFETFVNEAQALANGEIYEGLLEE